MENNKILAIAIVTLIVTFSASTVFARKLPEITNTNKLAYKNMLQTYFHPVFHGYGIGFNDDKYVTAKWHITNVRILARNTIRDILANNTNATDWSQVMAEIRNAIQNQGTQIQKGRIRIGSTDYILTNISITNTTASADIRNMPDYLACKQANNTAEDCEINSEKIGDFSLAKKTNAIEDTATDPKVWVGALNFNNASYTFVTFAYPKW